MTCSWRRRPKRPTRSGASTVCDPAREQRLALGVDEHVRPPQRVLDELEPLRGHVRREAADVAQVGQDLLVRDARRRGAAARPRRWRRRATSRGPASATARSAASRSPTGRHPRRPARRARTARRAGRRARRAATRTCVPRSASPSLIRHSGVLMRRIDASSRPQPLDQVGLLPGVLEVVARDTSRGRR